jgi:hypothetical protein
VGAQTFLHYSRAFNSTKEISKYNLFTCPSASLTGDRGELKTALGPLNTYKEYCNGFVQRVSRQRLGKHFPKCNNERCVSVDECYSSLLGKNQRAN